MGSIHTTVSSGGSLQPPLVIFCHQSSAIFSFLPPPVSPPPFFFCLSLPPYTLCNHLGPPECTVDICSTLQNIFGTDQPESRKKKITCHFFFPHGEHVISGEIILIYMHGAWEALSTLPFFYCVNSKLKYI